MNKKEKVLNSSLGILDLSKKDIILDEFHHSSDFKMEVIVRDFLKIFYVIHGKTTIEIDGFKKNNLTQNDILVVPKGIKHILKDSPEFGTTSIYVLSIKDFAFDTFSTEEQLLRELNKNKNISQKIFSPLSFNLIDFPQIIRKIKYEQNNKNKNHKTIIKSLSILVLADLERAYANNKDLSTNKIESIYKFISNNYFEEITMSQLANMLNVSINKFTISFKDKYKITPMQHLQNIRVEYAKEKLKNTSENIASICFSAGFNDLSNFYRVFKKNTCKSPLLFRNSNNS